MTDSTHCRATAQRSILGALVLALAPVATAAQPIVVEAPDGFMHIRCTNSFGTAACEFLAASPEGFLRCVAFDAEGQPLAVAPASARMGQVQFADLDAAQIDRVICQ